MANKKSTSLQSLILKRAKPKVAVAPPVEELTKVEWISFNQYQQIRYTGKAAGNQYLTLPQKRLQNRFLWTETVEKLNREVFLHDCFRGTQLEIINSVLLGEDALVVMPTGSGKSLTYLLPGVITQGVTIVVEPLLSLITDQMHKLRGLKIRAEELSSNQSFNMQNQITQGLISDSSIKFLYLTPERLTKSDFLNSVIENLYKANRIARLIVDEAHCVLQWGKDFRPDYLKLKNFRLKYPSIPILALTASGTRDMQSEISKSLGLFDPILFATGFNRQNLYYEVRNKTQQVNADIGSFITSKHQNDSGIVYCNYIKDCEYLAKILKHNYKISCSFYHGEMPNDKKTSTYKKWLGGELKVIVATMAFGLGIDKKDVRFIIHYSIPESIELYYQETGRAGRDDVISDCILYYKYEDKNKLESTILANIPNGLCKMIEYCEHFYSCRRKFMLEYLGEEFDEAQCGKMCDCCCSDIKYTKKNVTDITIIIAADVIKEYNGFTTLLQISEGLKGSNNRSQSSLKGIQSFGLLKSWSKKNIERLLKMLVFKKILNEKKESLVYGGIYYKLVQGKNFAELMNKRINLEFYVRADSVYSEQEEEAKDDILGILVREQKRISDQKKVDENLSISKNERVSLDIEATERKGGLGNEFQQKVKELNKPKTEKIPEFTLNFDEIDDSIFESIVEKRNVYNVGYVCKEVKKN